MRLKKLEFMVPVFKVQPCPTKGRSDPSKCPFLHAGEEGRRHPIIVSYRPGMSFDHASNDGSCRNGDGFSDLEAFTVNLPTEFIWADANDDRAAVDFILDLKSYGYVPGGNQLLVYDDENATVIGGSTGSEVTPKLRKDTFSQERVEILAAFDSSLHAGGSSVPNPGGGAASLISRLLLDSGASIHAVGDRRILKGYQLFPAPWTAKQPDGSLLSVVGVGTIQTECFRIPNVHHVEGLAVNLVSVSQLDRDHGMRVSIGSGWCGIMLPDGTTVGEAMVEDDGMYGLRKLHVPEPAHHE